MPADRDGVRIAELDETSYRRLLWAHEPITDIWRIVEQTMSAMEDNRKNVTPEEIMEADRAARDFASRIRLKG